ncbi:hypothetical protein Dsin_029257 [Dipteronia sinensis]|uniref:Uncharacterized protein n=1 Tax=Dipteronia sinensis TaxID=43782 RepID=A0AAD9ZTQ7_9ROSI|nr:hypothetical protein Dsin_029257 [Dipteronia sinensis]
MGWLRPTNDNLSLKRLSPSERKIFEEEFSSSEVWEALSGCDGNKSPGPNGLNMNFIKANWDVIREDVLKFIHEFCKVGLIVKDINNTFITLIPKIKNLTSIRDFRPISLMGSIYKFSLRIWVLSPDGELRLAIASLCRCCPSWLMVVPPSIQFGKGVKARSLFKVPVGIAQRIEKIQRSFLWCDGTEKRNAVGWESVCRSKSKGRLGIGRVAVKNKGLLTKWVWRFGNKEAPLWKQGVKRWCNDGQCLIGDGAKVNFWEDIGEYSKSLRESLKALVIG